MKIQKLAVLIAFAVSLSAARAEDNKVEVNVSDDGLKTEARIDTDRSEPKKKGVFNKGDGKILGLFPAPGAKRDRELDAELRADKDLDVDADLDLNRRRAVDTEVRTGSGRIDVDRNKDLNAEVKGDVDFDNDGVKVEADADLDKDDNKVFKKGDGKILGIDVKRDKDVEVKGDVDVDDGVEVRADVDTDTDIVKKNDGKTLGVDLDRNRSARVNTDVDIDTDKDVEVKAKADVDTDDEWVVKEGAPNARNQITRKSDGSLDTDKNDGRILGVPKRGFETVAFSKLPAPVQSTIREHALGEKIAELEVATKNGQRVYEVEIQRDGRNQELLIAPDGRLLWNTHAAPTATGNAPGRESGKKVEIDADIDKPDLDLDKDVKTEVEIKKD